MSSAREWPVSNLDREQMRNAALIYQIGRQLGASRRDITIALITAMQESGLRNVHYGDRDSLGLFQQRPSMAWGRPEQIMDPAFAIRSFFKGRGTNRGLLDIGNRSSMSLTAAAQAVQRSAFPNAYAKHIRPIREALPAIMHNAGDKPVSMDGRPYGTGRTSTFAPGIDPDLNQPMDSTGLADYLLGTSYNPILGAPSSPGQVDPSGDPLEMFTTPLRPMSDDEFASTIGGYGKGLKAWRNGIVDTAREFIGTPYVWGGTSPNGFDCSGLVQYVYNKMGIDLPRVSYQQANSGKRIGLKGLRPGDLVAWDNSSRNNGADHIAIYIGHGKIIEAPRPGLSVRVRRLGHNEGAWGVRMHA